MQYYPQYKRCVIMKAYRLLPFFCVLLLGGSACDSESTSTRNEALQEEVARPATAPAEEQPAPDPDLQQYELVVQNLAFSPQELKVPSDTRIQITLTNNGEAEVSLVFDLPRGNQELREPVAPGRRAGLIFTTPKKAGTYSFYSPLKNQRDRGLSGTLIVE